jgi:hypothetical protein
MNWIPPCLMKLRIRGQRHSFGLWLPLFLLWPIALAFLLAAFLILLPFAILALIFTWDTGWWRPVILGLPAVVRVCCALRGLTVDADGRDGHVEVIFR